jgi:hypothetical protein
MWTVWSETKQVPRSSSSSPWEGISRPKTKKGLVTTRAIHDSPAYCITWTHDQPCYDCDAYITGYIIPQKTKEKRIRGVHRQTLNLLTTANSCWQLRFNACVLKKRGTSRGALSKTWTWQQQKIKGGRPTTGVSGQLIQSPGRRSPSQCCIKARTEQIH